MKVVSGCITVVPDVLWHIVKYDTSIIFMMFLYFNWVIDGNWLPV